MCGCESVFSQAAADKLALCVRYARNATVCRCGALVCQHIAPPSLLHPLGCEVIENKYPLALSGDYTTNGVT